MVNLTDALARFASAPPFATLAPEVVAVITGGFIDTCATMIAGRDEAVVRVVLARLGGCLGQTGEADVLFGQSRGAAADASMVNATGGHAPDYDDVTLSGHPSTVLARFVGNEGQVGRYAQNGIAFVRYVEPLQPLPLED